MAEAEFIDLFADDNSQANTIYTNEPDFDNKKNIKIDDFKNNANKFKKQNNNSQNENLDNKFENFTNNKNFENRSYNKNSNSDIFQDKEETIIWAGAMFIIFGVFLFFLGYWLGKSMIKEVTLSNENKVMVLRDKLQKTKIENMVNNKVNIINKDNNIEINKTQPIIENPKIIYRPQEETVQVPSNNNHTIIREPIKQPTTEKIVAPPIKPMKKEIISKQENIIKKTKVETKPIEQNKIVQKGQFTIQVSAHTSLDKARSVEDKIRLLGIKSYIVEANVNGINYYRVRAGKFDNREDAEIALRKIQNLFGKTGFIISLN